MSDKIQDSSQEPSNKELNFRLQEKAMRDKYESVLAQERAEKELLLRQLQEKQAAEADDDDDNSEPYLDEKRFNKKLARFGEQTKKQTQSEIQKAVQTAIYEERRNSWIKQNGDFYDVLKNAEKLAMADPELAETILEMPDTFERQKLVYKNIKALGLHKEAPKQQSIQEKIDANRRSPYYQPTGVGAAPYTNTGMADFSPQGQKAAYDKLLELKSRIRL